MELIEVAGGAAVEELADLVARAARRMGLGEAVVYITDYEQRRLVPLPGRDLPVRAPVAIDGTLGGRAFMAQRAVGADTVHGDRLWVPIATGAERLGVLELAAQDTVANRRRIRLLATVTALQLVVRRRSADYIHRLRRRETMSLAAEIQWALLPPLTSATQRITISGVLEPSYDIAGDSFDYAIDGGVARLAIFDAMGHGFEATRMAMLAVGTYRHARRDGSGLEQTRDAVDEVVGRFFDAGQFITAQLAELDGQTGRLRWLNAGHPPPLLVRQQTVVGRLACVPTLPLGLGGEIGEIAEVQLEPGDRVLLFTDGVTEARSPGGAFFGDDQLDDFVVRAELGALPLPETLRRLGHALVDHQAGAPQDDATMVMLEWRAPAGTGGAVDT